MSICTAHGWTYWIEIRMLEIIKLTKSIVKNSISAINNGYYWVC